MTKFATFFVSSILCLSSLASTGAEACDYFRFETKTSLSIQDIGRLSFGRTYSAGVGSILYWPFDVEDHAVKGDYDAAGLVIARQGDLGEIPIGGVLWARGPVSSPTQRRADNSNDMVVTFTPSVQIPGCETAEFIITLKSDGSVYTNDQKIGNVR